MMASQLLSRWCCSAIIDRGVGRDSTAGPLRRYCGSKLQKMTFSEYFRGLFPNRGVEPRATADLWMLLKAS